MELRQLRPIHEVHQGHCSDGAKQLGTYERRMDSVAAYFRNRVLDEYLAADDASSFAAIRSRCEKAARLTELAEAIELREHHLASGAESRPEPRSEARLAQKDSLWL